MNYIEINDENLQKWLKNNLDEKRMNHSIGTAECARDLATKYNQNPQKAYLAGLLHDCAKCFSNEKLWNIIEKHIEIDEGEKMSPKTWHAPVSAYIAATELKVKDDEIIEAIRWHTVGKEDMSDFEKIIFIADKIEPRTRNKKYLENVRELLNEENGLDKAMLVCYKETIKSLVDRDLKITPATIYIYNNLQEKLNVN